MEAKSSWNAISDYQERNAAKTLSRGYRYPGKDMPGTKNI